MEIWAIAGGAAVIVAWFPPHGYLGLRKWSRPHIFPFEGDSFIWVPDPDNRPFGGKLYEYGDFQYADGTPVTDHRLHRMLQDFWVERNRRMESERIHS